MQSAPTIEQEKSHALKVLTSFLLKLEISTDSFAIEGHMYAIMRAAESAYQRMHIVNGGKNPEAVMAEVRP